MGWRLPKARQKHKKHRSAGLSVTTNQQEHKKSDRLGCWSPKSTNHTDRLGCRLPKVLKTIGTPIGWSAGISKHRKHTKNKKRLGWAVVYQKVRKTRKTLIGLAAGYQKTSETQKHQKHSRNLWSVGCYASNLICSAELAP